jgi:nucleotide-binding universal stress UspA family protein
MFNHILAATDGSDGSERAIRTGVGLAKSPGARVTVVMSTWPVWPVFLEDCGERPPDVVLDQNATGFAQRCLSVARGLAAVAGVPCEVEHAIRIWPYRAIMQAAEEKGRDLTVMASHGKSGVSTIQLGRETIKALAHTKLPVLVCH